MRAWFHERGERMRSATPTRIGVVVLAALAATTAVGGSTGPQHVAVVASDQLLDWDVSIGRMEDQGLLRVSQVRTDTLLPDRQHVRLAQFHGGVPVWGGELVRQSNRDQAVSVFGTLYDDVVVNTRPGVS